MKKVFIRNVVAILVICISFGLFACDNGQKASGGKGEAVVWTAPISQKLYKNVNYPQKMHAQLNASLAKNEYESMQLLFTPKENVNSYDLVLSDLKSGENVLKKECFTVYKQHYMNVINKSGTNKAYPSGWIPDGLIPMEYVIKAGEDKVKAGDNQGLWITVKTPSELASGIYSGAFTLKVDKSEYSVPVKIEIYNFGLSQENNSKTCFMLNQELLMSGELNNTDEMYKTYYDTLLDYRISPLFVPGANNGLSAYIENVKKYYDEGVGAYGIPSGSNGAAIDKGVLKAYLRALIDSSTLEKNLLSKGYYYVFDLIDEPQTSVGGIERTKVVCKDLKAAEEELYAELIKSNYFATKGDAFKEMIHESLLNIPNVVTTYYNKDLADSKITFCPSFENFDYTANREIYEKEKERVGSLWWYGCVNPMYPYPTYHIDDSLLGARVASWMQKDYNIDGNLYWSSAMYSASHTGAGEVARPVAPYENPQRLASVYAANGDGYLFYPGKKYNSPKPFPSLRLDTIRAGMEEYEYLVLLDKAYENNKDYYKQSVLTSDATALIYDSLYSGSRYINDFTAVEKARASVANLIELAQSDAKFQISQIDVSGNSARCKFNVAAGFTAKANGNNVPLTAFGDGSQGEFTITLGESKNEFKIELTSDATKATYDYTQVVSGKVKLASNFDKDSELARVKLTKDSVKSLNENAQYAISEKSLALSLTNQASATDPTVATSFRPTVYILTPEINFKQTDSITFNIYNADDEIKNLTINITSDNGDKMLDKYTLKPKQWNKITIKKIYAIEWQNLKNADGISLVFDNLYTNGSTASAPQKIYIDEFTFEEAAI